MTLRWEITAILCIKLILLGLLWYICFSHPVNPNQFASHIFNLSSTDAAHDQS